MASFFFIYMYDYLVCHSRIVWYLLWVYSFQRGCIYFAIKFTADTPEVCGSGWRRERERGTERCGERRREGGGLRKGGRREGERSSYYYCILFKISTTIIGIAPVILCLVGVLLWYIVSFVHEIIQKIKGKTSWVSDFSSTCTHSNLIY